MSHIKIISAALFMALPWLVNAQSLPLDPAVHTGKLPNGFTYYIRHNTEPKNRVVFYLVNKIGALQEDEDQRGLAHMMEHMSFNGTTHFPKNELVEYLQKSGVRFGADLNAYTGFDETVYQLPLPSDDSSIVKNGLQIMRDWASEATLDPVELDKERGVVLEEKRLKNGPGQRMSELEFPLQMNNSRYANRIPIGLETVLNTFTPATIQRFYKDWYRPDLQALIVVGDIDVTVMEQQIKQLFGTLQNPKKEKPLLTYKIPLTGKNQFMALTDPEQTTTRMSVMVKLPGMSLKTKEDYRITIVNALLNEVFSARFGELSTQSNPPYLNASVGVSEFMGGLGVFNVNVVPKPGHLQEAFTAVWTEVTRMRTFGLTQMEMDRAKKNYLQTFENVLKEKNKTPSQSYVKEYVAYFSKDIAAPGIDVEAALVKAILPQITLEEVLAFAKRSIKSTDRDIYIEAPDKDKATLPNEAIVNGWIAKAENEKLTPWKDNVNTDVLLKALPISGKVIKRSTADSLGVFTLELSNGIKVFLKPTDFKNDEILFSAFSPGGTSLYPNKQFRSASAASQIIAANGVGEFNPVSLSKMLTGKSVQVQPYIQELYEGMSGGASPADLETAMQLLYLYFTAPREDTMIFANLISRAKAGFEGRNNSPEVVFRDSVAAIMGMHNYRRMPITAQSLDTINQDEAFKIYKERFANAADFTFMFVGNLDTAKLIPLIERYIGSLPAVAVREKYKDFGIHTPEGKVSYTMQKGNDNKAVVNLNYSGKYTFSDANNMQLSALGTILQYKITERIRETEGGAYSPRAGVNYGKLPEARYAFSIQITCAPGSVDKLVAATSDEIEKLKKDGPSADDINKFIAEQTRTMELQLHSNGFWQQYIISHLQNNEPMNSVLHFNDRLKTVSVESVKRAADQYLTGENYIKLVLMPEQK
jgi:zinc protease